MKPKTIKDVFKKVDEMKKESSSFLENENSQLGEVGKKIYNQAISDVLLMLDNKIQSDKIEDNDKSKDTMER